MLTRDEKVAEARRRVLAGGVVPRVVAAELGVSLTTVYRWCYPERYSESRSERRAQKRAWEWEHDRKPCPCGALRSPGAHRQHDGGLCGDCHLEVVTVGRAMREERIAEMWAQGFKQREIAEALSTTRPAIQRAMATMRKRGWDLPRRYNWTEEGLRAAADGHLRRAERQRAC